MLVSMIAVPLLMKPPTKVIAVLAVLSGGSIVYRHLVSKQAAWRAENVIPAKGLVAAAAS